MPLKASTVPWLCANAIGHMDVAPSLPVGSFAVAAWPVAANLNPVRIPCQFVFLAAKFYIAYELERISGRGILKLTRRTKFNSERTGRINRITKLTQNKPALPKGPIVSCLLWHCSATSFLRYRVIRVKLPSILHSDKPPTPEPNFAP